MKKLSPSIIAHFPHVWSNQYWGTPNGVPQQGALDMVASIPAHCWLDTPYNDFLMFTSKLTAHYYVCQIWTFIDVAFKSTVAVYRSCCVNVVIHAVESHGLSPQWSSLSYAWTYSTFQRQGTHVLSYLDATRIHFALSFLFCLLKNKNTPKRGNTGQDKTRRNPNQNLSYGFANYCLF